MDYATKDDLRHAIWDGYSKYVSEFDGISEDERNILYDEKDRTPFENFAYVLGRTSLLIYNERNERYNDNCPVAMYHIPCNKLDEFYATLNRTFGSLTMQEMRDRLDRNIKTVIAIIDSMSDDELFGLHGRKWAEVSIKNGEWSVCKYIHMCTVAPFRTCRAKVRRWKKAHAAKMAPLSGA